MDLTKDELKELKTICDYLNNDNQEIKLLGFNLYVTKYTDKFTPYITNPRESSINMSWIGNCKIYVCDFEGYEGIGVNLAYSIWLAVRRDGYDFDEE